MMTRARLAPIALAIGVSAFAAPANAQSPAGVWLTKDQDAHVRIAGCGRAICGTIVWLKEPNDESGKPKADKNNSDQSKRGRPLIGVQIVLGMKPAGTDKRSGQVYNAEDGKTYSGSLTLQNARSLKLEGCVLGGLICKGQTWTRAS